MKTYPPRRNEWVGQGQVLRPVFGVDIDGTLAKYHEHFIRFASGYFGTDISLDYDGSVSLAKWCGVSKARYRRAKLAYRQGGLKRSMPLYPGMADVLADVRKRGALVAICTTRPYLSLENIDGDTREWLRRNKIQHDAVVWGEHKYRDLVSRYGKERIVGIVDDLPPLLAQASGLGLDAVMMRRMHNWRETVVPQQRTAEDAGELHNIFDGLLDKWEQTWR